MSLFVRQNLLDLCIGPGKFHPVQFGELIRGELESLNQLEVCYTPTKDVDIIRI